MHPQIRFSLNKSLDKKVCYSFLEHKKGGLDFGKAIIKIHPELASLRKLPDIKQKQIIGRYVGDFYKTHKTQLKKTKQEFQKKWKEKSSDFFKAVSKIFNHHPWPKDPYFCYISIFPCGPRFLEHKAFQVFYLSPTKVKLVAHEILHFLFYDYLGKYFPDKDLSSENVWVLSEIVNTLILDSPKFREILEGSHSHPYPTQRNLLLKLKPVWQSNNPYSFLKKAFFLLLTCY